MKVLLDTHAFIWWDSQPEQLSKEIVEFLLQPQTGTQKPGFFFAFTVNCYFHNRNPVSFSGQEAIGFREVERSAFGKLSDRLSGS